MKYGGLVEVVAEYGACNVFVEAPRGIRVHAWPEDSTEARVLHRIVEGRYKVADGYKVSLEPEDDLLFRSIGHTTYYISDLNSLLREGGAFGIYVLTIDGYQRIKI